MQTPRANLFEFGDFQLDAAKRRLRRLDGTPISLTPRGFDTLLYMVEHHDSVLDKERIMEAVWPDSIVEENNLAQAISKLRQVFGETPGSHSYIMFNDVFNDFARNRDLDLFPKEIQADQGKLSDFIYNNVNNGVYKAGFATRQHPYEIACRRLFQALDELEQRLSKSRYLFADRIVEADWRLFCTLVRFDPVYHGHFKCNLRRVIDYPNLQGYLMDLYQQPGIAETVNLDHIKRHYYMGTSGRNSCFDLARLLVIEKSSLGGC